MKYDRQILARYTQAERLLVELACRRAQLTMSTLVRDAATTQAIKILSSPPPEQGDVITS